MQRLPANSSEFSCNFFCANLSLVRHPQAMMNLQSSPGPQLPTARPWRPLYLHLKERLIRIQNVDNE